MPMPRKPEPIKFCQYEKCGKQLHRNVEKDGDLESLLHFSRRKFCNRLCWAKVELGRPKKAKVLTHQGRYRARIVKPLTPCEQCGSTRHVDRHHKDENPLNNDPANIENLCRRCHMMHHDIPHIGGKASAAINGTANLEM